MTVKSITHLQEESFITNILKDEDLISFANPVKSYKKRECFFKVHDYIYGDFNDKVLILYGLRRTGKTTIIRQIISEMTHKDLSSSAFLQVTSKNTLADVNHDLKILKRQGIKYVFLDEVTLMDDFIEGCKVMGFPHKPVCLKIVNGSGSRGVRIIDAAQSRYQIFVKKKPNSFYTSYEDMLSILREPIYLDEMMLVEYMPGNEYTVDLLADKGCVLYEVGRENTVSMMSIAQESILAYDEHAYQVCKDVVSLLGMDGNIGFDFMRDSENKAVLMDINPRLTATVSVIAAGGVNLPYLRIKQLLGEELPVCDVKYGTRLKRRYKDYFTIVK